ncbi:MAG: DUF1963 domain-containing protein [Mycobacterium sp.]|uniref:YwqG family protein n=1 Tax=Mycobacterium sp. TaxID=1785 RepID=UPI001ED4F18E|nr:DUF1963 domain-containing protein [Mycobacterium sp.]MBW0018452.1 DUF1963 domain-containing protein [Mycobacterium sp.]
MLLERTSIELELTHRLPSDPWGSKVGGTPYLVQPQDHPLDRFGKPLAFIAQLNFSELPNLLGFPGQGLLQFFITAGLDDDCVVIYHPTVTTNWTPKRATPGRSSPPALRRRPGFSPLVYPDSEFGLVGRLMSRRPQEGEHEGIRGHRVGGYPNFNQDGSLPDGHVLLFQLDSDPHEPESDWRIIWGDLGTGRFSIAPDELLACDFSAVHYEWDCC